MYIVYSLMFLLIVLLVLFRRCQSCDRHEAFVARSPTHYPLCDAPDYLTMNPYKYDPTNFQSEIPDDTLNKHFARVLKGGGISLNPENPADNPAQSLEEKLVVWINAQGKIREPTDDMFQIYDFTRIYNDEYIFTLYRAKKNHGKVLKATIISKAPEENEKDDPVQHVLKTLNVIGYRPEFDIKSDLNKETYDNVRFRNLEDRWQITEDEKIIRNIDTSNYMTGTSVL